MPGSIAICLLLGVGLPSQGENKHCGFFPAPPWSESGKWFVSVASAIKKASADEKISWPSKQVACVFTLTNSGKIKSLNISKSSGNNEIDQVALKLIRKAQPFKPISTTWVFIAKFNKDDVIVGYAQDDDQNNKKRIDKSD